MTERHDKAPGEHREGNVEEEGGTIAGEVRTYIVGLVLAIGLTAASFLIGKTGLIWAPGLPVALAMLAIAQMGVHLVFFLHLSTGPDNTNNVLALAFGILIVFLVVAGSLWIMAHLNANMQPMQEMMSNLQMQK